MLWRVIREIAGHLSNGPEVPVSSRELHSQEDDDSGVTGSRFRRVVTATCLGILVVLLVFSATTCLIIGDRERGRAAF